MRMEKTTYTAANYGEALQAMKNGHRVAREGWNGKNMYAFMIKRWHTGHEDAADKILRPFTALKDAQGRVGPWVPSSSDQLAEDWTIYPKPDGS